MFQSLCSLSHLPLLVATTLFGLINWCYQLLLPREFGDLWMEEYIVKLVAVAVVCWSSLFVLARHLFPRRSFGFCNRLVSSIHATLAVTLAAISVQDWSCPVCPLASKSSPSQVIAMQNVPLDYSKAIYTKNNYAHVVIIHASIFM